MRTSVRPASLRQLKASSSGLRTYVPSGCRPGFAAGADFTAALAPAGGRSPESAPAHAPSSAPATTRNRGVTAIFKLTSTRLAQSSSREGYEAKLSCSRGFGPLSTANRNYQENRDGAADHAECQGLGDRKSGV